jgi:hypothetical protein
VIGLVLLAVSLRVWLLCHTEVAARDSIGYIRYALALENRPWAEVLRSSQQHPGYPLMLLAASWPVRHFMGGITPVSMQISAQIANSVGGILLVVPMFLIGRLLWNRRVGFWAAALYQCLPASARILSDGLSEGWFLFFSLTALYLALVALRRHSWHAFALCGAVSGLAYLTRPEGALVAAAALLVLAGLQLSPWRRPWRAAMSCAAALVAGAALVGGPYALTIGSMTIKPTGQILLGEAALWGQSRPATTEQMNSVPTDSVSHARQRRFGSPVLLASTWGLYAPTGLDSRLGWGLRAVATEVVRGCQYIAWLPALLGLWWFQRSLVRLPGAWVVLALCTLQTLVLWRLAVVMGYVSERHVQILVLCCAFPAVAALLEMGDWVVHRFGRRGTGSAYRFAWLSYAPVLIFAGFGLPATLKTLHAERAGHRAAGLWLAEHSFAWDRLTDPYCWAHYYAGRVFTEGTEPIVPPDHRRNHYVVLDPTHEHGRLPNAEEAKILASWGALVYHWPPASPPEQARILVYCVRIP